MKYVKGAGLLLWISVYLTRTSARNPEIGRSINDGYGNPRTARAICNANISSAMLICAPELFQLTANGFPWGMAKETEIEKHGRNLRQIKKIIIDPLDPINGVCGVFEDFLTYMDEHSIPYAA